MLYNFCKQSNSTTCQDVLRFTCYVRKTWKNDTNYPGGNKNLKLIKIEREWNKIRIPYFTNK